MKLNNIYYLVRHGQALSNVKNVCSTWPETFKNPLTETGVQMVEHAARQLEDKNIDLIFSSDLLRTKQTAQIIGGVLNLTPEFDRRLREINFGIFNGSTITGFNTAYPDLESRFYSAPCDGENYQQIIDRMYSFLQEIEQKYQGKHMVIISHEMPITLLICKVEGLAPREIFSEHFKSRKIKNAEIVVLTSGYGL